MNLRQFLSASLLIAFLGSSSLLAQGHPHHRPAVPFEWTDEVKVLLEISPEQAKQLDEMQSNTHNKMMQLHQNTDLSPQERHQQQQAIREETRLAVQSILTIEQGKKWREYRQEKADAHKEAWANVDRKAMHEEMSAYHQKHIKPFMVAQRQQLESQLTEEEKNNIASIRAQAKVAHKKVEDERHPPRQCGTEKPQECVRGSENAPNKTAMRHPKGHGRHDSKMRPPHANEQHELMGWLNQNPEAYASLQAVVSNHQDFFDQFQEELAPQQIEWQNNKAAIFKKYAPKEAPFPPKPHGLNEEVQALHQAKRKEAETMHFILFAGQNKEKPSVNSNNTNLSIYPNPVKNTATVSFELDKAAQLSLLISNEKGYPVKTIAAEQYKEGLNKVELDLSGLPNGTYNLVLKGSSGIPSSTKMVVINN